MRGRGRLASYFAVLVASAAFAIIWIRLAVRPSSDLLNHREFGRRFVENSFLYDGGLDYPYLPTWAVAHAPLAAVPAPIVSVLVVPFGAAALAWLVWMLDRTTRGSLPLERATAFWVAAAAIALTSRFLIRDLLDGGENLMLTALTWAAFSAWGRQREWMAAALLGAAIALKLTAAVFLVVLILWREHGRAVRTLVCAAALVLLPAARMGVDAYVRHMNTWAVMVWNGVASRDPTIGVLGPEPVGNQSLRAGTGRLLVRPDASASWRATSASIATGVVLVVGLVIVVALWRRRAEGELERAAAWATAGVLALVMSPITWRAHMVAIVPACYLLLRRWAHDRHLHPAGWVALAAVSVPGLILTRGVLGETVSDWSDQRSLTALALVCLTMGAATWPTRR